MATTPGSQPSKAMPTYDAPAGGGYVNTALYVNKGTVIKATPGSVLKVNVLVAGAPGTINDCASTANAATGNQIAVIPATVGPINLGFPCLVGITYMPGASQVVSISYV